jgi:acyl-CoA thioester hydrolase
VEVEIADTDLGAVVYYGRYAHLIDRAVMAYRRHLGIPPLGPEGHLFVVRSLAVDYLAGVRFGDVLDVGVRTAAIGRTSHTVEVTLDRVAGDDDEVRVTAARATLAVVGVSGYTAPRPTRVPEALAAAIRAFEGDA